MGFLPSVITSPRASGPALGDVNGDGRLDLVFGGYEVLNIGNDTPALYAGLGNVVGTAAPFGVRRTIYTNAALGRCGTIDHIELADIDGDGHFDAVINYTLASTCGIPSTGTPHHRFIRGNGDGTFKDEFNSTTQTLPALPLGQYVWGDFDGDGKDDAVSATIGQLPGQIYWNDGGGTFSVGPQVNSSSFGDFDGDGQADFLDRQTDGTIAIAFGDGARGFGRSYSYSTPPKNWWIVDINEDGVSDLVTQDSATQVISVYVSTAKNPTLGPPDIDCSPLPADQCSGPLGF
jgi:hypothetical protein